MLEVTPHWWENLLYGLLMIPFFLGLWPVFRFLFKLNAKASADLRQVMYERSNKLPPFPTHDDVWRKIYHKTPDPHLQARAVLELLGQDQVDCLTDQVMRKYPVPEQLADPKYTDYEGRPYYAPACAPAVEAVPSPAAPEHTPKPVFFKHGEPQLLGEYMGQPHITEYLDAVIASTDPTVVVPPAHQLFCGPPGLGKTLLVRVFVNSLNARNAALGLPEVRFQEEFPADIATLQALDTAVRHAMQQPTVLFIDEIHDFTDRFALKLYMLLEDGRYKFEGEADPVTVNNVCLMGATTDSGAMHPALKRRFNRHNLEPMAREHILDVVQHRSMPIDVDAAEALVARTHFSGAPWEALQLFGQARVFAGAAKRARVALADVTRVFESQKIDELGLRWMDRRVIEVLLGQPRYRQSKADRDVKEFVCYGASETDVCVMAQVDKGEYRETVKPRLMARRLLQVRPTYGQALLPRAVELYGAALGGSKQRI